MSAPDRFSEQAKYYARFRPVYPSALYEYILDRCPGREVAWDAATGSGQAARVLAESYRRVIATDISADQIKNAPPLENIEYRVGGAEESGLEDESADLITVAQALHWFSKERFFREARRVLRPGGALAVWGYHRHIIEEEAGRMLNHIHFDLLGPYWAPEVQSLLGKYEDVQFPFAETESASFGFTTRISLEELKGYILSWSATRKFLRERSQAELDGAFRELEAAWGDSPGAESDLQAVKEIPGAAKEISGAAKEMKWSIFLRLGRKE